MSKNKKSKAAKSEPAIQPIAPQPTPNNQGEQWSPDLLLAHAEQEPARRTLSEYSTVIQTLRDDKNFTFREIATWLQRYNIMADHNAVYREYTRGMPDEVARGEELEDEQTEREEHNEH